MDLLIVGSMAFDAIETPFGKTDKIIGGAATYISLASSYFTNGTGIVSVVGDDFPEEVLNDMVKRNISIEGVEIKKGEKSFFWKGRYHRDLNTRDTLATELNVLANFDPVVPDAYKKASFLMLGNLSPDVQRRVIQQMHQRPKLIAMDTMNFWMDSDMDSLKTTISMVDILIINDEEARQLSDEYSLVKSAQFILNMGPKYLIIKKGEHGALLFHKNMVFFAPALPLEDVFDPTGAGDTFAGGFMGYLAKASYVNFDNMKRAVIYGSAMASFCVEKFGTERISSLTKNEIDNRIQDFISLVQVDIDLIEG